MVKQSLQTRSLYCLRWAATRFVGGQLFSFSAWPTTFFMLLCSFMEDGSNGAFACFARFILNKPLAYKQRSCILYALYGKWEMELPRRSTFTLPIDKDAVEKTLVALAFHYRIPMSNLKLGTPSRTKSIVVLLLDINNISLYIPTGNCKARSITYLQRVLHKF